jgi:hypothetical protein
VKVNIFLNLEVGGLSGSTLTAEYEAALRTALSSLGVDAYQVTFGDATISASSRRRLDRSPLTGFQRRLEGNDFVIPVTVETAPGETNRISTGLEGNSFAGNVTQELENTGESALAVKNPNITGMEVLFSLRAETISQIENAIINNDNFDQEFTDQAIAYGTFGSQSTATVDKSQIEITTFVPTLSPTPAPTVGPTILPTAPTTTPSESPSEPPTPAPSFSATAQPSASPSPRPTYAPSATPSLIPTATPFQVSATTQYPGYIVEATLLVTGISSEKFGADQDLTENAIAIIADEIRQPVSSVFFLGWTSTTTNTTDASAGERRRKLLESITTLRISIQIIVDDFATAQEVERRIAVIYLETLETFAVAKGYTDFTAEMVPTVEVYPMKIPTSDIETDSNRCLLLLSDFSVPIHD